LREWFDECVDRDVTVLVGLSPKSTVMVTHRPHIDYSSSVSRSWSTLLWWSCRRPGIEGQLPALWPLLLNWPHIGQFKVLLQGGRRVL
jgi:hypothetical protein